MKIHNIFSHFVIYCLLIGGTVLFAFPFIWMATTSVKVDRELFSDQSIRLAPITPHPRMVSPYIDDTYYPRPADARSQQIVAGLTKLVQNAQYAFPAGLPREVAESNVALGLYKKLRMRLPQAVWDAPVPALLERARAEVTPDAITEQFDNIYRPLQLGKLLVRSNRLVEEELGKGQPMSRRLENQTPRTGTLVDETEQGQRCAGVHYDFSHGDRIVLSNTFTLGFPSRDLQRLQLYLRPDDTWHTLRVTVEKNGKVYRARRAASLANFNWTTITWQEPGPDDDSLRVKTWLLLDQVKGAVSPLSDPHQLKLTIEICRSTQTGAWLNKLVLNYYRVFDQVPFWRYVRVSIFLVIANIVLTLFASSLVAYSFARLSWPGRDFAFLLMLSTMMIPGQVTMIPHFLIWKSIGAYDTLTPLWLGAAFGNAFYIFLMRQTLKGIPRSLEDAARMDGCGFLRIYWHIMLPLVRPCLAAIAIFTFMGTWNDFMGPLLYLSDQRLYPLSFGIYAFSVQVNNDPALTMAASLLMTLPVIIIFFFAQKYFIQGIAMTGMKG